MVRSPYYASTCAVSATQWAFQKNMSHSDLVAFSMCSWLLEIQNGNKVALFLANISGAFDRVHSEKMISKLRRAGLNEDFLKLFADYLSPRTAVVVADGQRSAPFKLENMVYQGTVLGPSFWNIFSLTLMIPSLIVAGLLQNSLTITT